MVYACALNRIFNYNCTLAKKMLELFPSPCGIFESGRSSLVELLGKDSRYPDMILDGKVVQEAYEEVEWARSRDVRIFYYGDMDYPFRLKECEDAPVILFYKGTADLNGERVISVVGTRHPDPYGENVCREVIRALAGLRVKPVVVSGLAYGIDICAHREALETGLDTVGVMATGIDVIYPRPHRQDAVRMCRQGGVLTDFWRGAPPNKVNFLRRNRLIAGLCDAVLLVESDKDGGGVVTSRMASSYSRDVFAVPGRITDPASRGCNALIREKVAECVSSVSSLIGTLGWNDGKRTSGGGEPVLFESDSTVKRNILVALSARTRMDTDAVLEQVDAEYQDVMAALTELELEGRVVSDPSGRYRVR